LTREWLLDDAAPQPAEPEAPPPREDVAPPKRTGGRPPPTPPARPDRPGKKPAPVPEIRPLPPLTTNDPPLWLRHLHWLLVLSLIPLAVSLLQTRGEQDFVRRLIETIDQAPADSRLRGSTCFNRKWPGMIGWCAPSPSSPCRWSCTAFTTRC
jgi:hypothetical protein